MAGSATATGESVTGSSVTTEDSAAGGTGGAGGGGGVIGGASDGRPKAWSRPGDAAAAARLEVDGEKPDPHGSSCSDLEPAPMLAGSHMKADSADGDSGPLAGASVYPWLVPDRGSEPVQAASQLASGSSVDSSPSESEGST